MNEPDEPDYDFGILPLPGMHEEDDDDPDDEYVPCSICSCLIGDEVAYGDTWDGRWVCAGCAGIEDDDEVADCDSEDN